MKFCWRDTNFHFKQCYSSRSQSSFPREQILASDPYPKTSCWSSRFFNGGSCTRSSRRVRAKRWFNYSSRFSFQHSGLIIDEAVSLLGSKTEHPARLTLVGVYIYFSPALFSAPKWSSKILARQNLILSPETGFCMRSPASVVDFIKKTLTAYFV